MQQGANRIVGETPGLFRWFTQGAWSVVDQGLFAGANFVLNILLARWLPPKEYGAFTVAFALFLLLGMYHTALLTEPMLVFGPGRFKNAIPQYVGVLLRGHTGFALLGGLTLGITGLSFKLFGSADLGADLLVLAVAQPFILFMWLVRRACYVELNPRLAASGGMIYVVFMLSGAVWLYYSTWLSVSTVLILMSLASLASGLWFVVRLRLKPFVKVRTSLATEAAKNHWSYGRWAAATGMLTWTTSQVAALILPIWAGLEGVAAFKALMNLTMPAIHAYVAFSVLLVPVLVRAKEKGQFKRFMITALTLTSVAMGLYHLLLGVWGKPVMALLYDGQYVQHAWLLWLVGSLPLLSGIIAVLNAVLRAIERPDYVFWAYVGTSVTVVTLGTGLIFFFGLTGAVLCQLAAMLMGVIILVSLVFGGRVALPEEIPQAPPRDLEYISTPHPPEDASVASMELN